MQRASDNADRNDVDDKANYDNITDNDVFDVAVAVDVDVDDVDVALVHHL